MTPQNDLYYITILLQAMQQEDTETALRNAFQKIIAKGSEPSYRDAYQRFLDWIRVGMEELQSDDPEVWQSVSERALSHMMISIATDTFEGSEEAKSLLTEAFEANEHLRSLFQEIRSCLEPVEAPPWEFFIEKDGEEFERIIIPEGSSDWVVKNIKPAHYTLNHANGRILWDKTLKEQEVLIEEALPGRQFPMAAETDGTGMLPTVKDVLLDGELTILVYPGFEAGTLTISVQKHADHEP